MYCKSPLRRRPAMAVLLLLSALVAAPKLGAAEKLGNSLDLVPADVSFFSSSLRLREQLDILLSSKAWMRLMEMPSVRMALGMAKTELEKPGGPKERYEMFVADPDNQQLIELLQDMVTNEIFVYGDKKFADSVGLAIEAFNAARYAPMFNKLANPDGGTNEEQVAIMALLEALNEDLDRLVVPDVVVGFKLKDPAKADLQMRRLEIMVKLVVQLLTINEFKDRFGRVRIGDADFLELRLDGKLVPWEELPLDEYEENPGDFEPLKKHLRAMKMTVNLGVKDGYFLFSIGDSNEHLANLGKGDLLVNRTEMKPLQEHLQKRLVGVGYTSKEFNSLITGTKEDVDGMVDLAKELLPHAELDDELEKRIIDDVQAFATDIKQYVPEPGASISFSFLTPRGYESFSYNWTQNLTLDDSQPLTLLNHVGGSPVLALVGRGKSDPKDYDLLVKWLKKGYGYFEEFAVPQMPDEQQEKFRQVAEFAIPLVKRVSDATRNDLIPALADGQAGLVLDANITSLRWHREMPSLGKPLPMVEVALVFGVSDADRLKKAFREYKAVAQAVVEKVREINPDAIPAGYQIPDPKSRETSAGQIYWYALPAESGLDPQIQPAAGVSKTVAVLSSSTKQVERMLASTPLETKAEVLADRKTAGSAFHFSFPAVVDAIRPWAELAVAHHASEFDAAENENAKPDVNSILEQVRTGAEILKCYRGTTSVSYLQEDATVTHRESIFEDLK